jgi:hypothetical protein
MFMIKKKTAVYSFLFLITLAAGISSCYYDNEEYLYSTGTGSCTDTVYTYTGRVKAIFDQNCATANCHSGASPESGIGLETYAGVKADVETGNSLCSITWSSGCSQMPKNTSKLDDCSITAIQKWKERGYPEN